MLRQFGNCSHNTKVMLFRSYCSNYYCSHLWWSYRVNAERRVKTAYNKVLRKLLGYDCYYSARAMFCENYLDNYDVLHRKYICRFYERLKNSDNILVKCLIECYSFYDSRFYKIFITARHACRAVLISLDLLHRPLKYQIPLTVTCK